MLEITNIKSQSPSKVSNNGKFMKMPTTTKKDLIDRIADETKYKRTDVRTIVQTFLDSVITELGNGNRLEFRDFGVFELKDRKARMAQNPRTLERVPVPARRTVKFKVGRLMKEAVDRSVAPNEMPVVETTTKEFASV
ncbi:MAG: HU family DNA-binding protein [Phycisphaerales bacterium]|jgi:integration host factor subunit beta|nr:HU family DNA-binding protein [Phycisphaerales bacterium]